MNFSEEYLFYCGVIVCLFLVCFFCVILILIFLVNVIFWLRNFVIILFEIGKLIGSMLYCLIIYGL